MEVNGGGEIQGGHELRHPPGEAGHDALREFGGLRRERGHRPPH